MNPDLVRRILFPLHERLLHRPTFRYLAELEQTQWLSRQEIERIQWGKLQELLRIAYAHCPWHRERMRVAGIDPRGEAELSLDVFRCLPTMDKTDASANREGLVWKDVPGGIQLYNTGGSSGQPLIFYYGRKRQAIDAASRMRARRWWHVEVGSREVFLWGSPVEFKRSDHVKAIRDRLFNQLLLNAFDMTEDRMDAYLRAIEAFDPSCIYGYASSLSLLAAHAKTRRQQPKLTALKVICTTGEPLFPDQRSLLREVFGVPVSGEYGCRDGGLIALESPDGQLLVNSESILLEILDEQGAPVPPGDVGEVVVTNLYSDAQPFIRYRTGDLARQTVEACGAGRGLHVVAEVMGRTTDFVVRPDGAVMHALAVIYVLRAIEGIREFKIIQWSMDRLEVLVRTGPGWQETSGAAIVAQLRRRMASEVSVEIRVVETIPPEASGKHRYVVSHVPLPGKPTIHSA